jgi:hypothetical protein
VFARHRPSGTVAFLPRIASSAFSLASAGLGAYGHRPGLAGTRDTRSACLSGTGPSRVRTSQIDRSGHPMAGQARGTSLRSQADRSTWRFSNSVLERRTPFGSAVGLVAVFRGHTRTAPGRHVGPAIRLPLRGMWTAVSVSGVLPSGVCLTGRLPGPEPALLER